MTLTEAIHNATSGMLQEIADELGMPLSTLSTQLRIYDRRSNFNPDRLFELCRVADRVSVRKKGKRCMDGVRLFIMAQLTDEASRFKGVFIAPPNQDIRQELHRLGDFHGFDKMIEGMESYLQYKKDTRYNEKWTPPNWVGLVKGLETAINMLNIKENALEAERLKREREHDELFAAVKLEVEKIFGYPKTLEERRTCNDWLDSYDLIKPGKRGELIVEEALTDASPGEKMKWRIGITRGAEFCPFQVEPEEVVEEVIEAQVNKLPERECCICGSEEVHGHLRGEDYCKLHYQGKLKAELEAQNEGGD